MAVVIVVNTDCEAGIEVTSQSLDGRGRIIVETTTVIPLNTEEFFSVNLATQIIAIKERSRKTLSY